MSDRRQYGTGTVYQRKDGLFIGRLDVGWTANGTRRRISASGKTKAQASANLRAKAKKIAKEGAPAARPKALSVKAWSDTWLDLHSREVRPKTYATDASCVRKWIVPTIGTRRLDALTPDHDRAVQRAMRDAGSKPPTILRTHNVLLRMLRAAVEDGHTVPPSILGMRPPKKGENERDAMRVDHAVTILEQARTLPQSSRWVAALLNGTRPAEALGLTWENVDFDAGVMDVSWQLMPLPYLDKADHAKGFRVPPDHEARRLAGAYHLVRPKTRKSQRILPLVPWLRTELEKWRQVAPDNEWGLVWTRLDNRPGRQRVIPISDKADRAAWVALQTAAGVAHPTGRPYDLYEARHTTATLLMEAGVDPKIIAEIMGHTSVLTTQLYQHGSLDARRSALEKVADRLGLAGG